MSITRMTTLGFPVLALGLSIIAFFVPAPFLPMKGLILPFLIAIMFGMGVTLTVEDFKRVFLRPLPIGVGVFLQFGVMPLMALLVSRLLDLPLDLTVGMVLVGSVAGGTASNVITYLAGGDVALSISMTLVSTMASVALTPLLTLFYVGQTVPVPALQMAISIAKIVVIPVTLGVTLNTFLPESIMTKVRPISPIFSVVAICIIIAVIIALNQQRIATLGPLVALAVMLHNALGLSFGYGLSKIFRFDEKTCRTIAIEVGMQNSGLAVKLASTYFTSLAALPGAIFSIWHNLSGSALAGLWGMRDARK
ncbi:MAG: bile acid:sodium symporter family protein [Desulfovibrio sp.]